MSNVKSFLHGEGRFSSFGTIYCAQSYCGPKHWRFSQRKCKKYRNLKLTVTVYSLALGSINDFDPWYARWKMTDVIHTAGRVYKKVCNDAHAWLWANSNTNPNPNLGRLSIHMAGRVYSHCGEKYCSTQIWQSSYSNLYWIVCVKIIHFTLHVYTHYLIMLQEAKLILWYRIV